MTGRLPGMLAAFLLCATQALSAPQIERIAPSETGGARHYAVVRIESGPVAEPSSFSAYVVPPGAEPGDRYRVAAVFARRAGDEWILHLRGWPEGVYGTCDIVVRVRNAEGSVDARLSRALTPSPRRLAVAVLMDDSYSMRRTDPQGLRVTAARTFAGIAASRGDVQSVCMIAFNHKARVLLSPTRPGDAQALGDALALLRAAGSTDMDLAFSLAARVLPDAPGTERIALVLSDGRDEPGRYNDAHRLFQLRGWPVYTVGLSERADQESLRRIASETGGRFYYAPAADHLAAIFRDIALALHHGETVAEWDIVPGERRDLPVDDSVRLLSFAVDRAGGASVTIQSPDDREQRLLEVGSESAFGETFAPLPGTWLAQGTGTGGGTMAVTALSDLEIVPYPVTDRRLAPGDAVDLACLVVRGTAAVTNARVVVGCLSSSGSRDVRLQDDGLHGDGAAHDGIYGGRLSVAVAGPHRCRFTATGRTRAGYAFERTRTTHFAVDAPPQSEPAAPVELSEPAVEQTPVVQPPPVVGEVPGPVAEPVVEEPLVAEVPERVEEPVTVEQPLLSRPEEARADLRAMPGALRTVWLAVLLLLLVLLLTCLLLRLLRSHPMAKYVAVSLIVHAGLLLLTMNILIETGVVEVEQLPGLAVTIRAVEQRIGFALTPPGRNVETAESATRPDVAQPRPDSLAPGKPDPASPAPQAAPTELVATAAERKAGAREEMAGPSRIRAEQPDFAEKALVEQKIGRRPTKEESPVAVLAERASIPEQVQPMPELPRPGWKDQGAPRAAPRRPTMLSARADELVAVSVALKSARDTEATLPDVPAEDASVLVLRSQPEPAAEPGETRLSVVGPGRTVARGEDRHDASSLAAPPAAVPSGSVPGTVSVAGTTPPAAMSVAGIVHRQKIPAAPDPVEAPAGAGVPAAQIAVPARIDGTGAESALHVTAARQTSVAGEFDLAFADGPAGVPAPVAVKVAVRGRPETGSTSAGTVDLGGAGRGPVSPRPAEIRTETAGAPLKTDASAQYETESVVSVSGRGAPGHNRQPPSRAGMPELASRATPLPFPTPENVSGMHTNSLQADLAFTLRGGRGSGSVSAPISLARYRGGDWDCSPTAMMYLSHQLEERTGMAIETSDRVVDLSSPELLRLPFVYMTGHKDFVFNSDEVLNLRRYLLKGGHLWADDSTHFNDSAFDTAFRREIERVLPGRGLRPLGPDFDAFRTGYDLSNGYEGYRIPPGDKYRLDYIEGIDLDGRTAVVYTRNDYGDGLNINPDTHPLKPSLTDLSPAEMQEGSVRMGVNLALYFLTSGAHVDADFTGRTGKMLRSAPSSNERAVPTGETRMIDALNGPGAWEAELWGDQVVLSAQGQGLAADFSVGQYGKAVFSRAFSEPPALSLQDTVAVEADSQLRCGVRLALGLTTATGYYETRPFYLKPGRNTALFQMGTRTFKAEQSAWEYRVGLEDAASLERITVLIHSPVKGRIVLRDLRAIRPERTR